MQRENWEASSNEILGEERIKKKKRDRNQDCPIERKTINHNMVNNKLVSFFAEKEIINSALF